MQFIYFLSFVAMLTFSQHPQGAGTAANSEYHPITDSVRIAQLTDRALDVLFKDPQTSLILLDSALANYDSDHLDAAQANAISIKGIALSMTGDNEEGLRMFHKARKYYELKGDERNVAKCVSNLANVHRMNGRTDSACYYMIESLHHDILLHDTVRLISDYSNIAGFLIEYDDMVRASKYLEACLNLEAKSGYFEQFAIAYQLKGYLAMEARQYEDAVKSFLAADERAARSGDERLRAILIRDLASARSFTGDEGEARRNFNLALAVQTDIGVIHHVAGILNDFGLFEARIGNRGEAKRLFDESLAIYDTLKADMDMSEVLLNMADNEMERGEIQKARDLASRSLSLAVKAEAVHRQVSCLELLSKISGIQGDEAALEEYDLQLASNLQLIQEDWDLLEGVLEKIDKNTKKVDKIAKETKEKEMPTKTYWIGGLAALLLTFLLYRGMKKESQEET